MDNSRKSNLPDWFHYHSFPRRGKNTPAETEKGLAILASMIDSGFLLAPEVTPWPGESKGLSKRREGHVSMERRISFTHLNPSDVPAHSERFGTFALEYDNVSLRTLGALPVLYVPIGETYEGYSGLGVSMAARLADLQTLLERLDSFLKMAQSCPDLNTPMAVAPDGSGGVVVSPVAAGVSSITVPKELLERIRADTGDPGLMDVKQPTSLGGTVGFLQTILHLATFGIQSFEVQLNCFRALAGLFYPCERGVDDELLSYFQQREWRIPGGLMKEGVPSTRKPSVSEVARLLEIDPEFFGKSIQLRSGPARRVDECEFLTEVDGKHVLSFARRLLCPAEAVGKAREMLKKAGHEGLHVVESSHAVRGL